jgi:multidrug efflux system outer membrane protein
MSTLHLRSRGVRGAWRLVMPTVAAAALAACGSAPVLQQPQAPALPATFAQAPANAVAGSEPAAAFWRGFQDAELDALITRALAANGDVRIARARLREARALAREADAANLPTLAATAQAGRARVQTETFGTTAGNSVGGGVQASWEVDLFGRRGDEQAAARADVAAGEAAVQGARLAVAGEVARTYFELRGLQERLRVARDALVTQRDALGLVQARLEAGRGTALDTERARALVLATEASVPALELQVVLARQRLAVLTGQLPSALDTQLAPAKPLPGMGALSLAAIGSPEALLRRRPDLIAAEQAAVSAAARAGVAHKSRWPRITLAGALGLNAARPGDLGDGASFVYNLGAQLLVTVFDGGALRARADAAAARNDAAVAAYDQAVLLALEDAEGALAGYTRTAQQAEALYGAAQAAERAAEIARGRFRAGVSDFLAVLDAERERLNARDRLVQAQTAAAVSVVAVYKALGGVEAEPATAPAAAAAPR